MTIENPVAGEAPWVLHCDVCPEEVEYDSYNSFTEMWEQATAEGWRASKTEVGEGKGEWSHTCPTCAEAADEAEADVRKPKASR